jgi:putative membrane protein
MFAKWFINALALLLVASIVPGFEIASLWVALLVALFLGILNVVLKPILIIFSLPINILTLGLFSFVINALIILLTSSIIKGFNVASFGVALEAAVLLWVISLITNLLWKK